MFGSRQTGVNAYAKVGIETDVTSASPHKLIVMLFDGAIVALRSAILHTQSGKIPEKGAALSKAISIIETGLRASLDKKAGGEVAEGLDSLYAYMSARLLQANLNNQVELMEEVLGLLADLRGAWNAIGVAPAAPQPVAGTGGAVKFASA